MCNSICDLDRDSYLLGSDVGVVYVLENWRYKVWDWYGYDDDVVDDEENLCFVISNNCFESLLGG